MIQIIDTHLHIWDVNRFTLPWLDNEPLLKYSYQLKDYLSSMKKAENYHIDKAVYIEVDVANDQKDMENEYIIKLGHDNTNLISAASISADLSTVEVKKYLDKYSKEVVVKGVRHVLHVPSSPRKACLSSVFVNNVRYLGKQGLLFEGCIRTDELEDLYALAQACPETAIVLDHMGIVDPDIISKQRPTQAEQVYKDKWMKNIENLSDLPNVVCKISGLNPALKWDNATLEPAIEYCFKAFGEDRVMFGSNYPVCNLSIGLDPWIQALIEITKDKSETFCNKFFYKNAQKIYQL